MAVIIVQAYSAFLITYLLTPNIKMPFTDIEGFVQDGSYELGFSVHSDMHALFEVSLNQQHSQILEQLIFSFFRGVKISR